MHDSGVILQQNNDARIQKRKPREQEVPTKVISLQQATAKVLAQH